MKNNLVYQVHQVVKFIKFDRKGQSLIELVFIVGIIVLGVTGIVSLIVKSMGARTSGYDRKTAVQIAEIKMEGLVSQKKNDPDNFWTLSETCGATGVEGYTCSIGFTNITNDIGYSGCGVGVTDCAVAVVTVEWQDSGKSVTFNRFFAKNE